MIQSKKSTKDAAYCRERTENMAKADIIKFRELLLNDADFQEKVRKVAEDYKGEKDERAVFENVLIPVAEEYGLSASYEEFRDYASAFTSGDTGELSEDELSQVAGGKGDGVFACAGPGFGVGSTSEKDYVDPCFVFGMGIGICFVEGVSKN